VARFLEKIDFEAIILLEQANQGRTVIEKVEAHGDVGFAMVLLTPDDTGCVGGEPEPAGTTECAARARLLHRAARPGQGVCAETGDLEIPSDFAGVVWEKMDDRSGWKQALGRELEAVGHEVDWNKVMRS
jgi:predicted nucleotide-binding protein